MQQKKRTEHMDVSAQVVLKPSNTSRWHLVAEQLRQAGFTIGPMAGGNFSISAPAQHFEHVFKVELDVSTPGVLKVKGARASAEYELPVTNLPPNARDKIQAVLFTRRPDFGPGVSPPG